MKALVSSSENGSVYYPIFNVKDRLKIAKDDFYSIVWVSDQFDRKRKLYSLFRSKMHHLFA